MDIRRLEVFAKLMETRSFSQTGRELDLTQPTVSGHIKTLEEEIGLTLFDRTRRKVRPTSAAAVLYDFATRMLELRTEAGYALDKFRGRVAGRLKLGASTIPGTYILPVLIGQFHRTYAETYLTLIMDDTDGIIKRVTDGELELGVVGDQPATDQLSSEPIVNDELVLAVPKDFSLAGSDRPVSLKALTEFPFILREEGSGTRSTMLKALAKQRMNHLDLNVVAEMGSTEAVRQAVKAGLGISILSKVAVEDIVQTGLVKIVPVKGLDLTRWFYLVTNPKRTHSPVCEAFLEFIRHESSAL